MALRNQPYLPLYVQDFMSDEKLRECSAESVGVYIFLMCLMHKSDEYGKITLTDKYICLSKTPSKTQAGASTVATPFAHMLAKHLPFTQDVIERSLDELLCEKVIKQEGNSIIQKRMVKDCEISTKRALAGSKGGQKRVENEEEFAKANSQAKDQANSEYESEYVNEDDNTTKEYKKTKKEKKNKEGQFEISVPDYLTESFASFVEMRKAKKSPMTEHAKELMLKKLYELSSDRDEQVAILNQSTVGSWTNIYSLKDNSQYQKPQQREVPLTEVEDGLFKIG
jgi:uncharacterized protein YdaU (DUF1376 family)